MTFPKSVLLSKVTSKFEVSLEFRERNEKLPSFRVLQCVKREKLLIQDCDC